MLDFDSLPPVGANTPTATQERQLAREIFEHAVILSVKQGNKENFQKCIAQLRPYYTGYEYVVYIFFVVFLTLPAQQRVT